MFAGNKVWWCASVGRVRTSRGPSANCQCSCARSWCPRRLPLCKLVTLITVSDHQFWHSYELHYNFLRQRRRYVFCPCFFCLFVCLSVSKITQKHVHGFGWNVKSTDVETWMNWLTFEPDPDYSPDAETGYRTGYGTLQPCLGCQWAVLLYGILCLGKSHIYVLATCR